MSSDYFIERNWREVNSRTSCTGDAFPQGIKEFKFSVGSGYGFLPNQSYFRITLRLTFNNLPPTVADSVCFADNVCGNLFNNIYFNCGGQTISQITNGVPQIDIVKSRLTKNSVYNKSIGTAQGLAGHYYDRRKLLVTPPGIVGNVALSNEEKGKEEYQTGKNTRDFIWQPSLGIFDEHNPKSGR